MRYDTPIYFQKITQTYNTSTGDYDDDVNEVKRFANVTDAGTSTVSINFGKLKQGSKLIRLQTPYNDGFDSIRIGTKAYRLNTSTSLGAKSTLVVNEVM